MAPHLQSESSAGLIPSLSPVASAALQAFQREHTDEFRHHNCLLLRLIPFLTDEFDIDIDPDSLPDCEENESVNEETVRHSIVVRLLNEFWDVHCDIDPNTEKVSDIVDYQFLVKLFYWHLNRQTRLPSNLTRPEGVETRAERAEQRRRLFDMSLRSLLKRQRETIQQQTSKKNHNAKTKGSSLVKKVAGVRHGDLHDVDQDEPANQPLSPEFESMQNNIETVVSEPMGISIVLSNLGSIDRLSILDTIIDKVMSKYEGRYGMFLKSDSGRSLKAVLEGNLNQKVKSLCEAGTFELDRLLQIGNMGEQPNESGVYMHILYRRSNPGRFWLYVGQAFKLHERISSHNDPAHRQAQPSLHYHVWESAEDMVSEFVTLAVHKITSSRDDQFILNFQEMWMACVFQTMTAKHLEEYLPESINKAWSGRHLNVAPPIWQGFGDLAAWKEAIGGTEAFKDFLNSPDSAIRGWAWDLRHAFNDLRNSPDPIHRAYYFDVMLRNRKLAEEVCEKRKIENLQRILSQGMTRTIFGGDDTQKAHLISCSGFAFTISRQLRLGVRVGDLVRLRFHLTATPNPQKYATKASQTDPASRLAVSIEGGGTHGDYHVWLRNPGDKVVSRMNALVDALEGVPLTESKEMARRWYVTRRQGTSKKDVIYTVSDDES
ncbi:hypothetical protein Asppvi_002450 [Aspergillus pseudoviridinutans]|uniref:GIY-YIG domain-containing protein n=1 Tax=Aspergillus pseudoviridinutans TaxID=1517512 RepID=A0A9P3B6I6_9EURO|nr:uncharacterized protein Asppvi_002450 [Aspergillus pseudoviridinutans]GIJ83625.1 hypothetical protein Asppvi_002450 [Aspergillus pseudoviridinutans]